MKILVWNMGNGGPGNSEAKHERAWRYLADLEFDVALLQETRKPPAWASGDFEPLIWNPKYSRDASGRALWGCAVVGRSLELQAHEPDGAFPWLKEFEGSCAIAWSAASPRWLASVHSRASAVPDEVLSRHSLRLRGSK